MRKLPIPSDIKIGARVNMWTLLEEPTARREKILCRCDCGREIMVVADNVIRGLSKRCRHCSTGTRATTHGESDHTGNTRLYRIWKAMKWRCNPKNNTDDYRMYYERGVRVCDAWAGDYIAFRDWALQNGYDDSLSIDRFPDLNGGYSPDNCRWATSKEQCRNTKKNHYYEAFGERKLICQWVLDPRCVVNEGALKRRLEIGWKPEFALTLPTMKGIPLRCRGAI